MPQRTGNNGIRLRQQQPPCLGRQDPIFAGQRAQGIAENSARLAKTIERRSVEIANTGRPRRPYNRLSLFSSDRDPVSPEGSGAEPEDRQSEGRAPHLARLEALHTPSPPLRSDMISYYNQPL